jgi:glycerol-3-phosphate acyltransferase PlsY
VFLARSMASQFALGDGAIALVALAVFVGHLFPVYHRFAGGKGVATAAGVLLAINPWLGLATLVTWLLIAFFFRYSSLAALVSAAFAPIYYVFLFGTNPIAMAVFLMSALLVWRHRGNIAKLMAGKESRIGDKKRG